MKHDSKIIGNHRKITEIIVFLRFVLHVLHFLVNHELIIGINLLINTSE